MSAELGINAALRIWMLLTNTNISNETGKQRPAFLHTLYHSIWELLFWSSKFNCVGPIIGILSSLGDLRWASNCIYSICIYPGGLRVPPFSSDHYAFVP